MLTYSPIALYHLAKLLYPDGYVSQCFLPIVLEGHSFELRFSTDRGKGDDVEFMLHLANTDYARRGFIVYENGTVEEETRGTIPEWDKRPGEAALTLTVNECARAIFDLLLGRLEQALPSAFARVATT
jgi:hypothetical protein